jgi:hypothetical protein
MKPFNLTYLDPSEDEIHEAVASLLDRALPPTACWYSVEHRNAKDAVEGAKRKRRGVRAGIPDITIIYGRVAHFIELKARAGVVSSAQEGMRTRLTGAGALWAVCRSVDDVVRQLRDWRIPCRVHVAP